MKPTPTRKPNFFSRTAKSVRNNIVVGLLLATPIVVTGFIVNWIFKFSTNRLLPDTLKESEYNLLFRAAAILAVLFILFLIGLFVRNIVGKKLYQFGDTVLTRIPIINKVYVSLRQISEAVLTQHQSMFKEVVLVEYPRRGLRSVAFVTSAVPQTFIAAGKLDTRRKYVSLFVPTTPNPTSGVFIVAARDEVTPLPLSISDAVKLIISGGVAYPGLRQGGKDPNLLDRLEDIWRADRVRLELPHNDDEEQEHAGIG